MKFGEIPPIGIGDIIYRKLLTDDGHLMITIAHLEPIQLTSST